MRAFPRRALIEARRAKYRSAYAFAAALGVNRTTVWRWERGVLDPGKELAERAAQLLERPVDELFGDDDQAQDAV